MELLTWTTALLYLWWEAWSAFVLHCLENTQERMEVRIWAAT